MNRLWTSLRQNWYRVFVSTLLVIIVVALITVLLQIRKDANAGEVGLAAVNAMYNFSSVAELDDNMSKLKDLTTPEVYDQLTIDNTERTLRIYLKFKNKPTYVVPDTVTKNYVIYSLNTETLDSNRRFVFFFTLDRSGKINSYREAEVLDLDPTAVKPAS